MALKLYGFSPRHACNLVPSYKTFSYGRVAELDKVITVVAEDKIIQRILVLVPKVLHLCRDCLTKACQPEVRTIVHFDCEPASREHDRCGGFR